MGKLINYIQFVSLDPSKLNKAVKQGSYPIKTIEEVTIQLDEPSSNLCRLNMR